MSIELRIVELLFVEERIVELQAAEPRIVELQAGWQASVQKVFHVVNILD